MNKKIVLPYIVTTKKKLTDIIVFFVIWIIICVIVLFSFHDLRNSFSFNATAFRLRVLIFLFSIDSISCLCLIPLVKHDRLIYVDYEVIKFKDDKYILHTCRWDNIIEMSFVPLSTYRKRKSRGDPSYVIRIEPYHGKEMFLDYSITVLNLYKFRRIVREASGRDDILQSKGPLWTKMLF